MQMLVRVNKQQSRYCGEDHTRNIALGSKIMQKNVPK